MFACVVDGVKCLLVYDRWCEAFACVVDGVTCLLVW